jgi:putative transposase
LMPNHVHLIAVPKTEDGLRRAIGEAHRRYTRRINFRKKWCGYLWQGRFASFVMDEPYLLAAARYVELNPVRARLVTAPSKYRWSSARAHLKGKDDLLVKVSPLLKIAGNWRRLLTSSVSEEELKQFREHERTGRVLGDDDFQKRLEKKLGRVLRRQKPGPKKK